MQGLSAGFFFVVVPLVDLDRLGSLENPVGESEASNGGQMHDNSKEDGRCPPALKNPRTRLPEIRSRWPQQWFDACGGLSCWGLSVSYGAKLSTQYWDQRCARRLHRLPPCRKALSRSLTSSQVVCVKLKYSDEPRMPAMTDSGLCPVSSGFTIRPCPRFQAATGRSHLEFGATEGRSDRVS
jgi:hypothetical protein